jgi:hypothetical protein
MWKNCVRYLRQAAAEHRDPRRRHHPAREVAMDVHGITGKLGDQFLAMHMYIHGIWGKLPD